MNWAYDREASMWRLRLKALLNVLKPPQGTEGRPVRECTYYFFHLPVVRARQTSLFSHQITLYTGARPL